MTVYSPDVNLLTNTCTLDAAESVHIVRVMRLTRGAEVQLADGSGNMYACQIAVPDPKACQLLIVSQIPSVQRRNYFLHLAVAPTKNADRFEWFIEKATEIGVDEITPIICAHSERRTVNAARLEKVAVAAMKQSNQAFLPRLNPATPVESLLEQPFEGAGFIAHCQEGAKQPLHSAAAGRLHSMVLIGPEGDFSPDEIAIATASNFTAVSLGNTRLRTETAAIAACHTFQIINS
ncbi:MAG: 16S rRNA (uracil(1498)-N(3))-methyltransferase [Bacteroidales bacterium]|jgi:16S rRNA (uracil1498-N3)-methyltransferase|nr:16S rRNA (uracil(1498)-N(3))-methyltransferase [Bacteroidales bacterium]